VRNSHTNQVANVSVNVKVPITIQVCTIGFVALVIGLYYFAPKDKKQDVAFGTAVIASASGLYAAFYAGRALNSNLDSKRIDRTMECASQWHSLDFSNSKKLTRQIAQEVIKIPESEPDRRCEKVKELVKIDPKSETAIRDILNFFEQLAVFVEKGVVDEELLKDFYLTIIVRHYQVFEPWIEEKQKNQGLQSKRLYKSLCELSKKWGRELSK